MTNVSKLLAGFAAILALVGCVHPDFAGMRDFWTLHDEDFRQLKPGMTQEEVQKRVGQPPWRLAVPRKKDEEIWNYRYLDYQTRMRSTLYFDTRGILKRATQEFDMDYYDCGRC